MFASLAYRNFTYLLLGQTTHAAALWLDMVARPLLVLTMTGSPVHLGLVMATRTVPTMAFGALAGVIADNFDRRIVLLITKLGVLVLSIIFAALVVTDLIQLWQIYLFTFIRGITMAFDQPARRAMIPSLVPKNLVTNAMALSSGSIQVMRIVGAGCAGLIIALGGLELVFITITFFYAAAVISTWVLQIPSHVRPGYQGIKRVGIDLLEGFRFAWSNDAVKSILLASMGYFTFGMTFMSVFGPLFATQILDIGESGFGYLMSITGIGGVIGALSLASVNPNRKRGVLILTTLTSLGIMLILFSAVSYLDSLTLVFVIAAILGVTTSAVFPIVNAVLVESAPMGMRGRVLGLLSLDRGMTTLGGTLAGFLAAGIGPQLAQIIFGIGCIGTSIAMFKIYPAIRRID
ncbi:MAG: MFS transporter [SAR202 cluster bacterium]|nr:MFS transporter [SAR202 cluster bacterium]